jgi:hypothetical protein
MAEATTQPTVYVETTVISYLTGWPSRDLVRAAHQQITREWWDVHRPRFAVVASELVATESAAGDAIAATERLQILSGLRLLRITDAATELAEHLVRRGAIPKKAVADALHVALAAVNGIDFVLTWNCRHLANAFMRSTIEAACIDRGFRPPIICTPDALSGGVGDER